MRRGRLSGRCGWCSGRGRLLWQVAEWLQGPRNIWTGYRTQDPARVPVPAFCLSARLPFRGSNGKRKCLTLTNAIRHCKHKIDIDWNVTQKYAQLPPPSQRHHHDAMPMAAIRTTVSAWVSAEAVCTEKKYIVSMNSSFILFRNQMFIFHRYLFGFQISNKTKHFSRCPLRWISIRESKKATFYSRCTCRRLTMTQDDDRWWKTSTSVHHATLVFPEKKSNRELWFPEKNILVGMKSGFFHALFFLGWF